MNMCFQNGIKKVLTLSYDDGGVQDIRLIDLLDKYGVKCTFNICSGTYLEEDAVREKFYGKLKLSEAKELYIGSGHEIALHSYSHPFLTKIKTNEIIWEITEDQRAIARDYGILARGMAYPQGAYDERVMKVLEICGIEYARTCVSTNRFIFPENWLELHPTCKHTAPNLKELITKFVEVPNRWGNAEMFYLWGHSFEFDDSNNWNVIEEFLEIASGHSDIWYATNIEIYDYVKAYKALSLSYGGELVYNPSAIEVWFEKDGSVYSIAPGETLKI